MDISVVIPLLNESESLTKLFNWIKDVMKKNDYSFEVIFIDDGSTDDSWETIAKLAEDHKEIKGLSFRRNYGKSAALNEGFSIAKGKVVITMDADLQDSPDEIPELYRLITKENYDLISGWKKKRYDPLSKTIPTKLFNGVTRMLTGIKLHDFNCGLKAYKNEVVSSIEVYGEMHRYIPVIAKWSGFKKIGEKAVEHRAREFGTTKFGMERFINGFLDLLSILFVSKFRKKPMHLFGALGTIVFIIGFAFAFYLAVDKIFFDTKAKLLANRTEFFLAITAMVIGTQLFLAGFLAELIARNSPERNVYHKKNTVGITD